MKGCLSRCEFTANMAISPLRARGGRCPRAGRAGAGGAPRACDKRQKTLVAPAPSTHNCGVEALTLWGGDAAAGLMGTWGVEWGEGVTGPGAERRFHWEARDRHYGLDGAGQTLLGDGARRLKVPKGWQHVGRSARPKG